MLLVHQVHIPEWLSLAVIFISLGAGVLFSLYKAPKAEEAPAEQAAQDIAESASSQLDARSEGQGQ
jgi:tellurite resistance protein TerC